MHGGRLLSVAAVHQRRKPGKLGQRECGLPNTTMSSWSPSNDGRLRVRVLSHTVNGRLHHSNQAILSFSLACSTHLVNFSSDQFSAMAVCWSVSLILTNVLPRA